MACQIDRPSTFVQWIRRRLVDDKFNKCVRLRQPNSVLDVPFIFPALSSALLAEAMAFRQCSPREPRQQPAPPVGNTSE